MEDKFYIYELVCPLTNKRRYIGKSTRPEIRLSQHLQDESNERKQRWVEMLFDEGIKPIMNILETTDDSDMSTYFEKRYIRESVEAGDNLFNIAYIPPTRASYEEVTITTYPQIAADMRNFFKEYIHDGKDDHFFIEAVSHILERGMKEIRSNEESILHYTRKRKKKVQKTIKSKLVNLQ